MLICAVEQKFQRAKSQSKFSLEMYLLALITEGRKIDP